MCTPRHIGKRLIDGKAFDEGCVVSDDLDCSITEPLILVEMAIYKNKLRAQLPRISPRHAALHTESLSFVRSC